MTKEDKQILDKIKGNINENLWALKIEIRTLERAKLSANDSKLLEIEKRIMGSKNLSAFFENELIVIEDYLKEI